MHDIIPQKGKCDVSRDLFKFWEISDNILVTVEDRDSCSGTLIGNRMCHVEWHQCQYH